MPIIQTQRLSDLSPKAIPAVKQLYAPTPALPAPLADGVTEYDLSCLRHMVGASEGVPKRDHGYRNHFAAGSKDQFESMERLLAAGFVVKGAESGDLVFYHATREGCVALGMNPKAIKNALGG
jgi:hypothetical protein